MLGDVLQEVRLRSGEWRRDVGDEEHRPGPADGVERALGVLADQAPDAGRVQDGELPEEIDVQFDLEGEGGQAAVASS